MRLFFYIALTLFLCSCSKISGPKQEDIALQAAKAYYDQLISGDYNSFVEGALHGDTVPADYKAQLITNAQMFLEQQQEAHQGIENYEASRATCDSTKNGNDSIIVTADAFLIVHFKDGSKEEISIPMIRKGNIWYLR